MWWICLSRISYECNPEGCACFLPGFFLSPECCRDHPGCCSVSPLHKSSIAWMYDNLFLHFPGVRHEVASTLGLPWINPLWTFMHKSLHGCMTCFLVGEGGLNVEVCNYWVMCSTYVWLCKKMPVCVTLYHRVPMFWFLQTVSSFPYCQSVLS